MFIKLLIKALGKRFSKLSPEEKQNVRELANNETKSETTEKKQKKVKIRRTKKMADEKEVKNEVETSKVETQNNEVDKDKSTEVVDKVEDKEEVVDKKTEDAEPKTDDANDVEPTAPQVQETEPVGNGVRVEDLVTKDELMERLAAFEAKFSAVVKENEDLKNQLSTKDEELNGMKDKYENKDFGNFQKQGMIKQDKVANSTFDEYSRQFM